MGTMAARTPSSPETAVLRSCEMVPIHSRAARVERRVDVGHERDHFGAREGQRGRADVEEAMAEGVDPIAIDVVTVPSAPTLIRRPSVAR